MGEVVLLILSTKHVTQIISYGLLPALKPTIYCLRPKEKEKSYMYLETP